MAETLSTLSIISFALAVVFLVLAVFFWFFFNIPAVIGDLTGRTARKSIARMRAENEKSGKKVHKESKTNMARGKVTGAMAKNQETGLLVENHAKAVNAEETGLLSEEATGLLNDENITAPLNMVEQKQEKRGNAKKLIMLEEVILIHTNEVIE